MKARWMFGSVAWVVGVGMGAWPAWGQTVIHVSTGGNDGNTGLGWETAKLTVQAGLNAAVSGDQVWVAAGTYVERITLKDGVGLYGGFAGGEMELSQRDWKANETRLDGSGQGPVVISPLGATLTTRIDGFTVTNGVSSNGGGGIHCTLSSPTITNNTIIGNATTGSYSSGGGILCTSQSCPTIANNIIAENSATQSDGGGIHCSFDSAPTITNNTIRANNARLGGGGIVCHQASPTIINNSITGNAASNGAGVCCYNSSSTMANNTITENRASASGGGICCSAGSHPTIANNTIARNSAFDGGGIYCDTPSLVIAGNRITGNGASRYGGGIDCTSGTMVNNTVTGNSASNGGGICCRSSSLTIANTIVAFNSSGIYQFECSYCPDVPTLRHNCVYGNTAYNYSGMTDPTGTDGNLSADPKLAARGVHDWHIQPDSPCVDAGENGCVYGELDVDGQARIQPEGGVVDIGADESDGTQWPEGPHVIVRVSPDGNDANDGSDWTRAKRTVQAAIDVGSTLGGEVWVKGGTYREQIILHPFVHVYGGFNGTEDERKQRDFRVHVTTLEGQEQGGSVINEAAGYRLSTIDGFTVTSGHASAGSGIYCYYSSPTITNNTITGHTATGTDPKGGGIHCYCSRPMIANNIITGNTASGHGGGIYCYYSSPIIANNTITGNESYGGGGIYCEYSSSPMIANNTVSANSGAGIGSSSDSYPTIANNTISGNSGGGIYCSGNSSLTIANNMITANGGEGIYCSSNSSPTITNNTISANSGAGIGSSSDSHPTITNTVIAFNESFGFYRAAGTRAPVLRHNCVYGNTGSNYSGISDPTGADGNVSVDPKPADRRYGNWHIQPDSPCVNAGDNGSAYGEMDVDGQARIHPEGGMVDIGADESDRAVWPAGPYVIVRVSPDGNDANDGSDWTRAKRTVQAAIDVAFALGGEVWVAAGIYPERIVLHPFVYLYGGFSGAETDREQRDFRVHGTILDGQQGGSVVRAMAGYIVNTIDGFTITNGSGTVSGSDVWGGGICCYYSSPTIANNTITGNTVQGGELVSGFGGGIYCACSSATIVNNIITRNTARGGDISYGGGICCSSAVKIINNTITGDIATSGGGIYCSGSSGTIVNNTVTGNSATSGGGICCRGSSWTIVNNTITGNIATSGGGICCEWSSFTMIGNNTITGNRTSGSGGGIYCYYSSLPIANNMVAGNGGTSGGGIYCDSSSSSMANNTITENSAGSGGGVYCSSSFTKIVNTIIAFNSSGIYQVGSYVPTLTHDCVYGNIAYNYSGMADPTGTEGNVSGDPVFVRRASAGADGVWGTGDDDLGDLRLRSGSVCIDAGDNTGVPADSGDLDGDGNTTEALPVDLAGKPRFVDDPTTDTGVGTPPIVDMGAYERGTSVAADLDWDYDVDGFDFLTFANCYNGSERAPAGGCQEAASDFEGDGDVDGFDFLTFANCYNGSDRKPLCE